MFARCAWTSGFNHELELDEFARTAPRSPFIVGDSCPERTATGRLTGPGPAAGASRSIATVSERDAVRSLPTVGMWSSINGGRRSRRTSSPVVVWSGLPVIESSAKSPGGGLDSPTRGRLLPLKGPMPELGKTPSPSCSVPSPNALVPKQRHECSANETDRQRPEFSDGETESHRGGDHCHSEPNHPGGP